MRSKFVKLLQRVAIAAIFLCPAAAAVDVVFATCQGSGLAYVSCTATPCVEFKESWTFKSGNTYFIRRVKTYGQNWAYNDVCCSDAIADDCYQSPDLVALGATARRICDDCAWRCRDNRTWAVVIATWRNTHLVGTATMKKRSNDSGVPRRLVPSSYGESGGFGFAVGTLSTPGDAS